MKNSVILPSVSRTTSGLVPSLKQGSRAVLVTTSLGGNALKNIMWEEIQMTSTDRTMAQLKPFERGFIPKWSHNEGEINTCEILTLRLSWASALRCLHHTSLFKTKRRNIHLAPETEKKKVSLSSGWSTESQSSRVTWAFTALLCIFCEDAWVIHGNAILTTLTETNI